jgi:hypothetical protein
MAMYQTDLVRIFVTMREARQQISSIDIDGTYIGRTPIIYKNYFLPRK